MGAVKRRYVEGNAQSSGDRNAALRESLDGVAVSGESFYSGLVPAELFRTLLQDCRGLAGPVGFAQNAFNSGLNRIDAIGLYALIMLFLMNIGI